MRGRRSRTVAQGLPEERKALVVRYMLDAEEALRREQLAVQAAEYGSDENAAGAQSEEEQVVVRPLPSDRPAGYVIKLRGVGFLWRWAVFEGIGVVGDSGWPSLASDPDVVAAGVLPRLSERSARRAAERAACGAFRQAIASE